MTWMMMPVKKSPFPQHHRIDQSIRTLFLHTPEFQCSQGHGAACPYLGTTTIRTKLNFYKGLLIVAMKK